MLLDFSIVTFFIWLYETCHFFIKFRFFQVNLRELEQYSSASKFEENRIEFDLDLHQNLELWDTLMKVFNSIIN